MAEAVNSERIIESVSVGNLKTVGDASAHSMALAMQNAVAHQNRMNVIAEAAIGNVTKRLTEADPIEAISAQKLMSGNDLGQQLAQLLAALASNQQGVKAAGTTPPVTV